MTETGEDPQVACINPGLMKSAGLRSECFETAVQFQKQPPDGPKLPNCRCQSSQDQRSRFQRQLKKAGLQIPIVFISAHGDIPMTVKPMKSGTVEFLTKPFEDQDYWLPFSKLLLVTPLAVG